MTDADPARLRAEIAAFYAGFGQPETLYQAFHEAPLVVPLVDDDRVSTARLGGVDWICVFTTLEEYARHMAVRGVVADQEYRYHTILGSRLVEYAASRPRPTGVAVDPAGYAPMTFPPEVTEETAGVV